MSTQGVKRKLSAILSADVEGYSRLMAEDEVATVQTLTAYREVMTSLIQQHRGRVVDSPGDNLLAEFSSVVDAVQCAVAVQKELQARNAELPEDRRMEFRIGINLGDVIEEGDRIYGDGVNIAARLEALADSGGICVSKTAFDQIETKLPLGYEYLGDQTVKNIPKPVGAYRVLMEPRVTVAGAREEKKPWPVRRKAIVAGAAAVIVVAIAVGIWHFYMRPAPSVEPASLEKMAYPLPDKPSLAVLPFDNLSGDPEQDHLCHGLTENIINGLSKIPEMFVIARHSTFIYEGKPVKVQQVAEDLGVRYVLEGSVQRSGEQLRVTAQLIDALKGHHVWSESYDRQLKDFFAVQDDITLNIAVAMQVELTQGQQALVRHRTSNLRAWSLAEKAHHVLHTYRKDDIAKARELFKRAVELDPNYAYAWTYLGWTHWCDAKYYSAYYNQKEAFERAAEIAQKALSIDDNLSDAHALLGAVYLAQRKYDEAIAAGKRAIALDPNGSEIHAIVASTMQNVGDFETAITLLKQAMRLSPYYPRWYVGRLGVNYRMLGRYEEAVAATKEYIDRAKDGKPHARDYLVLAIIYSMMGREEEARDLVVKALEINPKMTIKVWRKRHLFKDPAHTERILDALRKAGLPENPPLPLPEKPSIAVLPFTNMSEDPKQEYFVDGMTDDLITDLSKISGLFVIARNSVFTYKGEPVKIKRVSQELGVRYVLEGSVRKVGDHVRINAQLIDATTGGHLWAERYDGNLGDVFALQDKVTRKIVTALAVKLTTGEQQLVARRDTDNVKAYDEFLRGREHYRRYTSNDVAKAVTYFKKAIKLDPNYTRAHAWLATAYWASFVRGWAPDLGWSDVASLAKEHLQIAMENPIPEVHRTASWVQTYQRQYEEAIAEAERAMALNPNDADNHYALARALIWAGRSGEAIDLYKRAMRLDPYYPAQYLLKLGLAQFCVGDLENAATAFERARKRNPGLPAWPLAATYAYLGREQEAAEVIAEYMKRRGFKRVTVKGVLRYYPFKDPKDKDRFADGLRKAGLK